MSAYLSVPFHRAVLSYTAPRKLPANTPFHTSRHAKTSRKGESTLHCERTVHRVPARMDAQQPGSRMGRCSSGSTSHRRGHLGAPSIRIIIKRRAADAGVEAQRRLNRKPLEGPGKLGEMQIRRPIQERIHPT